jgi:signal peptidase I
MKIFKITMKVIYWIIFVLLILSATFILLTTYDVIPKYSFYVVLSGSMEPSIKTGSVIGVREEEKYEVKDIVTVKILENPNETYTHRIVKILEENDEIEYVTKGDANESEDIQTASEDLIIGKKLFSLPLLGYVVNFAKNPTGFILMVIVPAIIIIASELNVVKEEFKKIIDSRKKKKNEEKDIKKKKEALKPKRKYTKKKEKVLKSKSKKK